MDDDDNEKSKRAKVAGKRRKASNSASLFPSSIVCTTSADNPGALEMGVLLCILVVTLYLFGFYEAFVSLPENGLPKLVRGDNFNLAHPGDRRNFHDSLRGLQSVPVEAPVPKVPQYEEVTQKDIVIPPGKWPVSIRDEELDDFETIIHPGDLTTEMKVPKLWSYPVHNHQLMSREMAMKIGSCIEPDEHGNFNRGDSCPLDQL